MKAMPHILERLRKEARFPVGEVASYLGMSEDAYLAVEKDVSALPYGLLEKLAELYHVEEYDILTGTARSQAVTHSPKEEAELVPFFKIVQAYMKMTRLLEEAKNGQHP